MNYTVNDLAYMQDIQAFDEKITALAEQYHTNDLEMYATVDEVNDVLLKNYIQKGDLTEAVNKTTIYTTNEVDDKFALKSEIHILPTDHVTTAQLTSTLTPYALKSELETYRKKDDIMFPTKQSLEYIQESNTVISTEKFVNGAHIIGNQTDVFKVTDATNLNELTLYGVYEISNCRKSVGKYYYKFPIYMRRKHSFSSTS